MASLTLTGKTRVEIDDDETYVEDGFLAKSSTGTDITSEVVTSQGHDVVWGGADLDAGRLQFTEKKLSNVSNMATCEVRSNRKVLLGHASSPILGLRFTVDSLGPRNIIALIDSAMGEYQPNSQMIGVELNFGDIKFHMNGTTTQATSASAEEGDVFEIRTEGGKLKLMKGKNVVTMAQAIPDFDRTKKYKAISILDGGLSIKSVRWIGKDENMPDSGDEKEITYMVADDNGNVAVARRYIEKDKRGSTSVSRRRRRRRARGRRV